MKTTIDRRTFIRFAALSTMGSWAPSIGNAAESSRFTDADRESLAQHWIDEAARSGKGPYGELRYRGYRGLAELPWFEIDDAGILRNVAYDLPMAIDVHTHLAFGPSALTIDLQRSTDRVEYFLDCDATDPGCELDLDVYINTNMDKEARRRIGSVLAKKSIDGSGASATHTIANLIAEMDAMRVERSLLLPIAVDRPQGDLLTEHWMEAIRESGETNRLLPGASVHPKDERWREQLRRYAAKGARVVKVHPTMQLVYPDADEMMEIYAECERLGLIVFFHCGRAGIELEFMQRYALPRYYEAPIKTFPNVQFVLGHGGSRDMATALPLAVRYENAWLDTHGQGVTALHEMLKRTGGERMLFGSDWPWYHLAASLAKLLIITEDQPDVRHALLRGNATRLLGLPEG